MAIRFVIKGSTGYFTEMQSIETRAVHLNGNLMGHEDVMRPKFGAVEPTQAAHFNAAPDAKAQMENPHFGGPESFAGCVVEPTET